VKLLIVRHGPAGKRGEWEAQGRDDSLRPLTPKGKKVVRRAAAGIVSLVPTVDILATSPWTRAAETAEILAREYGRGIEEVEQLTSEHKPEDLMPWLREQQRNDAVVAVVGHEPHLGQLVGYLLTGRSVSFVNLKKGGACLLEMETAAKPGTGVLQWLLTDQELRRVGE
jgi:phosphohistidine phosphatase